MSNLDDLLLNFPSVKGDGKVNSVVCAAHAKSRISSSNQVRTVVFFPGDVSDFEENMAKHRDNQHYVAWSYENIAKLLLKKFSSVYEDSYVRVLIIRPKTMNIGTFAVYSNFASFDEMGNPSFGNEDNEESEDGLRGAQAWLHLDSLLSKIDELYCTELQILPNAVSLCGFSKGCVVLNQLHREASHFLSKIESFHCFKQLDSMYWLDGGHNGGKNTWLVKRQDVSPFIENRPQIKCRIFVTPYQLNDANRPWIAKECKRFVANIRQAAADTKNDKLLKFEVLFKDETRSLENHFRILSEFPP